MVYLCQKMVEICPSINKEDEKYIKVVKQKADKSRIFDLERLLYNLNNKIPFLVFFANILLSNR